MEWSACILSWDRTPIFNPKYRLGMKGGGFAVMGFEEFDIVPTFTLQDVLDAINDLPKPADSKDCEIVLGYGDVCSVYMQYDDIYSYETMNTFAEVGSTILEAAFNFLKYWKVETE